MVFLGESRGPREEDITVTCALGLCFVLDLTALKLAKGKKGQSYRSLARPGCETKHRQAKGQDVKY